MLGKNFLRMLMEEHVKLPDEVWARLNVAWALVFGGLGVLNLVLAYQFSERAWGFFKVFGSLAIILACVVAQTLSIARYLPKEEPTDP